MVVSASGWHGVAQAKKKIGPRKVELQALRIWRRYAAALLGGAALASAAPAAQAATRGPEVIVQFGPASSAASRAAAVRAAGGRVTRDVALIHAAGVRISLAGAARLAAL